MHTALVCGHICLDLTPRLPAGVHLTPGALVDVGSLHTRLGGSVGTTGSVLAAMGATVTLQACIGDDDLGRTVRSAAARSGASAVLLDAVAGSGTSYSVVIDVPGRDRTFWHHTGANAAYDGTRVGMAGTDLIHLGYPGLLPALTAHGGAAWRDLLRRARHEQVTTSVDLSFVDPRSPAAGLDWPMLLQETLPLTDVLTPSREDLTSALGWHVPPTSEGLTAAAARLVEWGAGAVLLSAGRHGMALVTGSVARLRLSRVTAAVAERWAGRRLWVPAVPVIPTTTTGAGDAATAGLLFGLLAGLEPGDAVATAAGAAAFRVTGVGHPPPYRAGTPYGPTHTPEITHDLTTHDLTTHDLTTHDLTTHDLTTHDLTTHDLTRSVPCPPPASTASSTPAPAAASTSPSTTASSASRRS
jgi:sugar/nucleoside kinase (ribokinase family)